MRLLAIMFIGWAHTFPAVITTRARKAMIRLKILEARMYVDSENV